jgi:hypothetical protein
MTVDKLSFSASDPDPFRIVSAVAPFLGIAHQIAGRVRLKLEPAALDVPAVRAAGGTGLQRALEKVRGVRAVQINLLARSCVVEYDAAVIPDAAWPDLLAGRRTPAAEALAGVLREQTEVFRNA